MIFSELNTSWQGQETVQQVLVFASLRDKKAFDTYYINEQQRLQSVIREKRLTEADTKARVVAEDGHGAIYKLQAVEIGACKWVSVILSGVSGELISQAGYHDDAIAAIRDSYTMLLAGIKKDIKNNLPTFKGE